MGLSCVSRRWRVDAVAGERPLSGAGAWSLGAPRGLGSTLLSGSLHEVYEVHEVREELEARELTVLQVQGSGP